MFRFADRSVASKRGGTQRRRAAGRPWHSFGWCPSCYVDARHNLEVWSVVRVRSSALPDAGSRLQVGI